MNHIITQEMVADFNSNYLFGKSSVRLKLIDERHVQILVDDMYLDDAILRLTSNFYDLLESFFRNKYDIERIFYNNYMTTFWAIK